LAKLLCTEKEQILCGAEARRRRHTLCIPSRRNEDIRACSAFFGVCFLVSAGLAGFIMHKSFAFAAYI